MERVERLLSPREWVDELYAAFVRTLPEALVEPAWELAPTLGLAPSREIPWSEVFSHEVTLAAPVLVAEALSSSGPATSVVKDATLAHMLAILEAFATDRVEDGQVSGTPTLVELLSQVRRARDEALARVAPLDPELSYARAERDTLAAIHAERAVLKKGSPISFAQYVAISHGKQRVGLPASLALARAAGWDARRIRFLERMLDAVWVALQLHDDVIDWEDDLARGGSWATSLAAEVTLQIPVRSRKTVPASAKQMVLRSGVLARMLAASARRFRAARRRAEVLGALRLAAWARAREADTSVLAQREAESPGFANRAHALSVWAKTVLP